MKKESLSIDEIKRVYDEMIRRQEYEGTWIKADGKHEVTDVGYAVEGAYLFLQELAMYSKEKQNRSKE